MRARHVMHNRCAKCGARRADVPISGGSVPAIVNAAECWSPELDRSDYTDSAVLAPTIGDSASCVFPAARF